MTESPIKGRYAVIRIKKRVNRKLVPLSFVGSHVVAAILRAAGLRPHFVCVYPQKGSSYHLSLFYPGQVYLLSFMCNGQDNKESGKELYKELILFFFFFY